MMTRAEIKSRTLKELSPPGAPHEDKIPHGFVLMQLNFRIKSAYFFYINVLT